MPWIARSPSNDGRVWVKTLKQVAEIQEKQPNNKLLVYIDLDCFKKSYLHTNSKIPSFHVHKDSYWAKNTHGFYWKAVPWD